MLLLVVVVVVLVLLDHTAPFPYGWSVENRRSCCLHITGADNLLGWRFVQPVCGLNLDELDVLWSGALAGSLYTSSSGFARKFCP